MLTWLLGYLLIGFVLSWCATHIAKITGDNDWRVELATVLFWPLTIIIMINKRPGHG